MSRKSEFKQVGCWLLLGAILLMPGCQRADAGASPVSVEATIPIGSFCSVGTRGMSLRRSAKNELHLKVGDDDVYFYELSRLERTNLRAFILSRLRISKQQGFHADSDFLKAMLSDSSPAPSGASTVVLSDGSSKQLLHWFGDVHWVEIHVLGGTRSTVEHLQELKERFRKAVLCSSA
jgi:hypothetical protein